MKEAGDTKKLITQKKKPSNDIVEFDPRYMMETMEFPFLALSKNRTKPILYQSIEFYIEKIKEKFNSKTKSELFDKSVEMGFFNIIPESILNKEMSIILEKI